MYLSFTFFFYRKKKVTKKTHHENQPPALVLPANALRHRSTKLAVRAFRGQLPAQY
jgi:hypothetical protein